jgi:hypothetical protein
MSVPLDRLYHYLDDCVNHDLLIYGWRAHGSTKLEDFCMLMDTITPEDWQNLRAKFTPQEFILTASRNGHAVMICHDQEPLNVDRYSSDDFKNQIKKNHLNIEKNLNIENLACDDVVEYCAGLGLRGLAIPTNHYDCTILLHSEKHSTHVTRYSQQGYVPVYYWSHGMIALDWFRYAEHDPKLQFSSAKIQQDFLIYNRAWSGTREYRLCFAEQLVQNHLYDNCKMAFNSCDDGYYGQHQFANPEFQLTNFNLDNFFPANTHPSSASADYCVDDYVSTGIEIVLETLFDDDRWHLTEKSLRPIACGKPFVLMATPGSLQYLRQYGFKTFGGLIDETYDNIQNPKQRLQAVIAEMKRISVLPVQQKTKLFSDLDSIAKFNKHLFFTSFFDSLVNEYKQNIDSAMIEMAQHRLGHNCSVITQLMQ